MNRIMKNCLNLILLLLIGFMFQECTEKLPKVLIIGDSIAGDYFPIVEEKLKGKVLLYKATKINDEGEITSCEGTTMGVKHIDDWLGDTKWDVIHFNFGLHDIKHIDPETGKNSKNLNDPQQANPEQYGKNLRVIVEKLKASGAKLIFATTTPYPDKLGKQMRTPGMPAIYNKFAIEIMKKNDIEINDLYSYVLPRMEKLQRPKNVHFTEKGYQVIGNEVAEIIRKHITK
jgi:lysophospholipase L1-like esterase